MVGCSFTPAAPCNTLLGSGQRIACKHGLRLRVWLCWHMERRLLVQMLVSLKRLGVDRIAWWSLPCRRKRVLPMRLRLRGWG